MTTEPPSDSPNEDAWIVASPYYVRCTDPECSYLACADPPKRHYHYVGERRA